MMNATITRDAKDGDMYLVHYQDSFGFVIHSDHVHAFFGWRFLKQASSMKLGECKPFNLSAEFINDDS